MADTTFVNGTPVVPDWLNDVNDFVYHSNVGDATGVTYTLPGSGNTRHVSDVLSEHVSVTDFPGADPTGVSDSSAAFNAALASGKAAVFVPEGTYLVDGLNFPASGKVILFGVSKRSSILKKNGNGDMITIPNGYCELRDLFLDGNAAAGFTGRGVVYSSATTPNCEIESCQITNFDSYCVEFAAPTAGSGFTMRKCRVYRYNQAQYAIKTANDAGAATPRKFIDCLSSGGNFLDLSGADNTQIIGGAYGGAVGGTAPFKFDANSNKAIFSGVRFFNGGGSVVIKGRDSVFVGCAIAGSLTIGGADADNIIIDGCVVAGEIVINAGAVRYTVAACQVTVGITDFAMSQYGWVDIPLTTYTPTITGSVSDPTLGNGTVTGSYRRHRDTYKVNIEFTFGSTSTVGSGYWKFSLPITRNASAPNRAIGVAHVFCAATGVYSVGAVVCPVSDPGNVTVYCSQDSAQVGQNHPGAWAAGDRIWLQIDVPIY